MYTCMYKSTVMVIYSEVVLHCLPCKPEARSTRRLVHLPHTSTQSEFCLSWNVQEYTKPYAGPNQRWCILSRWHVVESTHQSTATQRKVRSQFAIVWMRSWFVKSISKFFDCFFWILIPHYCWLHRVLLMITQSFINISF